MRKLVAIMFTDIVGYSALSQKNEKLALELLDDHFCLLRPLFRQFNGQEIKTIGDAFLVEFLSAVEALRCAVEIQKKIEKKNALLPPEKRIQIRIGIHVGDVIHRDQDIFGDGVNIASRIQPLAEPGGVYVTDQVYVQARNKVKETMISLGKKNLKNIETPVEVYKVVLPWKEDVSASEVEKKPSLYSGNRSRWLYLVLAVAILSCAFSLFLFLLGTRAAGEIRSLAVLPLQNLSGNPEQNYFADGMTEALISELSKIHSLRVISRTSIMQYKKTEKPLSKIAKELKVDAIVEGSALLVGDKVRISAQLVKASPEEHLWADDYDRDLKDILTLQREVTRTIARKVRINLSPSEKSRLAGGSEINPQVYKAYLKGLFLIHQFTEEAVRRGIRFFEEAVSIDSENALAYAGLAESYDILTSADWISPQEGWSKVKENAMKALQLDGTLSEAYVLLADIKFVVDWDWEGAEEEFIHAIELNPSSATARQYYALFLSAMERHEEAIDEMKRALESDPLSLSINQNLGAIFRFASRYDESIQQLTLTTELDPNFSWTYWSLGEVYLLKSMFEEAVSAFETALKLSGNGMTIIESSLARAYASWGKTGEARRILENLIRQSKEKYVSPFRIAVIFASLGEREDAFFWLEKAFEERSNNLVYLKVDPALDNLRSDPRFEEFLRRLNWKTATKHPGA
jgi:adenylate cyclase